MTATDELRRMLDERGVEYETDDTQVSDAEWYYVTKLRDGYHDRWIYEEPPDCDLMVSYQYDLGAEDAIAATLGPREQPPYDELIEALRRDWDIEASWDGLRRFWYVGLTDEGVRKRDEREATLGRGELERENAKLRELVRIAGTYCVNGYCGKDDGCPLYLGKPYCALNDRMRELGVEVDG